MLVLSSFNKQAELKQKKLFTNKLVEQLGLIQNNLSIDSFISLYMLAKCTHYTLLRSYPICNWLIL